MKLFLENETDALKRIDEGDVNICVIGVGTVGLPLATFLASKGFNVIGLDTSEKRVKEINSGEVVFEYHDMLKEVVGNKKLSATTNPNEAIPVADVILICVPTPLDSEKNIDLSKIFSAVGGITKNIDRGPLIVLESSVSIGVTRRIGQMIEKQTGFKIGIDFGLAYCPERYNPILPKEKHPKIVYNQQYEDNIYTMDKVSRVIGGADKKSLQLVKSIYSKFISAGIKEVSSLEAAEASKLMENIFRDVNIALVNELAKIYPKFGLDVFEIIDAAKTKPFAFLPHYPGPGVGGECIPVDTWYLIKQAENVGLNAKFLRTAREVNDSMPFHVVEMLEEALKKFDKKIEDCNISLLGLAYKKNTHDTRLSPTKTITEILKNKNVDVKVCDPFVAMNDSADLTPIEEMFKNSDAVILMTDHDLFREIDLEKMKDEMRTPIIIDTRNFFDKQKAVSLGFAFKCIGKAD